MNIHSIFSLTAAAIIGVSAFTLAQPASAQAFPNKPVQLIIPFAPGDTDRMLRPFTDKMGEFLGQPVVMTYKPGAGGAVGAGQVAASKPDGYTIVGTSPGSIVVVPLANKDVSYNTESFEPIAALSEGGFMLVVQSNAPWKNLKELVEASKKEPGKITYSTSGSKGITNMLGEIFAQDAGVKWTHIPYQGSGPAITALLGGHVNMSSTAVGPAQSHIQSGSLRPLAVFGDQRLKAFPDVPTLKELGYSVGSPVLYGILAPKGTPKDVIDTIYSAAKKASEKYNAEITAALATLGAQPNVMGPKEYGEYIKGQKAIFAKGVKLVE